MRFAAIGLVLATGCCPGIDFSGTTLHFDETFTDAEYLQLLSAVAEWSVALDRPMPDVTRDEPHGWRPSAWLNERSVIHRMLESEALALRDLAEANEWLPYGPNFVGLASPGGSIIIAIERIRSPEVLRHVMLHECGHVYSCLKHTAGTLMAGSVGKDLDCVDATTLEAACDAQPSGCGPNATPTCTAEDY